jgi:lysozyme
MTPNAKRLAALTVAGSSLLAFIAGWEGTETTVYQDVLVPAVYAVCNGHTVPASAMGEVWTEERCVETLAADTKEHGERLLSCVAVDASRNTIAAFTSLAFNVGTGAVCKSTAIRLLNAGKHAEACNAILAWNRAGGRVVKGLVKRREAERKLCLTPDETAS